VAKTHDRSPPPDWLPDWRDAARYPHELSDDEWRWQFLRRHPEYQRMYHLPWTDGYVSCVVVNDGTSMHSQMPIERARELAASKPNGLVYERVIDSTVSERFGVKFLLDPAIPTIDPRVARMFWRAYVQYSLVALPTPAQWERDYFVGTRAIVFDLRLPLEEQLTKAQKRLEREQRDIGFAPADPAGRKDWATYLRLLDARARHATWEEIGTHDGLLVEEADPTLDLAEHAELKWQRARNHLEKFFR
jgi:hypothetical protein